MVLQLPVGARYSNEMPGILKLAKLFKFGAYAYWRSVLSCDFMNCLLTVRFPPEINPKLSKCMHGMFLPVFQRLGSSSSRCRRRLAAEIPA